MTIPTVPSRPRPRFPSGVGPALAAFVGLCFGVEGVAQTIVARYPLQADLLDATGVHGPIVLTGNPTPPGAPNGGVCTNGVHRLAAGGQDLRTPNLPTFDVSDFQISVEFQVASLPTSGVAPILVAGATTRWLVLGVDGNGVVGVRANGGPWTWGTLPVQAGPWYTATLQCENGSAVLLVNGLAGYEGPLGPFASGGNLDFTTNDDGAATALHGCLRNLTIANDTTLGSAGAVDFGTGCDGLQLTAVSRPQIGAVFALHVSDVPPVVPIGWLTFGTNAIYPGLDLAPVGMNGCVAYTTFDLGMYGGHIAFLGTAVFPVWVPYSTSLLGGTVAAQGVAFSNLNPAGFATSNGTQLRFGW